MSKVNNTIHKTTTEKPQRHVSYSKMETTPAMASFAPCTVKDRNGLDIYSIREHFFYSN